MVADNPQRPAPLEMADHPPEPSPWREELWMRAWCSVAGAFNCQKPEDATRWADKALAAFDERFPQIPKFALAPADPCEDAVRSGSFRFSVPFNRDDRIWGVRRVGRWWMTDDETQPDQGSYRDDASVLDHLRRGTWKLHE